MKLLYAAEDRFPPFRVDVVDLIAREIVGRGHEVDWMMRRGAETLHVPAVVRWLGSRVFLAPALGGGGLRRRASLALEVWGDLRLLGHALRGRYDVIVVRDRSLLGLYAAAVARLTGARFVYWMSYPFAESKLEQARARLVPQPWATRLKGHAIRGLLYRAVLPLADHVFVQSEQMKRDVAREGIAPARMSAVPMGVRAELVGSAGDARAPDAQAPLLLHLGVLLRLRRSEMLVRVLARVRERYPRARLVYVGDGQRPGDRRAVLDEAARLGLQEAVQITGFLPMEQALQQVRAADVCFSPYYPTAVLRSTSPTKLVEYLALAKCVVANDHPEQTQVLRDSGVGDTVPWGEETFAQAVFAWLADPAAARERAARGPAWVRAHRTYPSIADGVERALERLARPPQGA